MVISFREFIRKQKPSESPAGDFINDAKADSSLPDAKSWKQLETYLELQRAIPEAIAAAKIVLERLSARDKEALDA